MLTLIEKIIFVLLALASAYAAYRSADRIIKVIKRGTGSLGTEKLAQRAVDAALIALTQRTVFKRRLLASIAHAFVVWGFTYYLLVNIGDGLQGFFPGFVFLGEGIIGNLYRLAADLLSVGVLVGMASLLVRRLAVGPKVFGYREGVLLHPKALNGIKRDSLIVGSFILFHVGSRFVGESFRIAEVKGDAWQPFASAVSGLWAGLSPDVASVVEHVAFWGALGSILLFVPYFIQSKHIHIFFAPLNYLLKPKRASIGQLEKIDFEDQSLEQFGATRLEHLTRAQIVDAYACIMCNRCQDVCPAYQTGKVLSPSALEINKRYWLNEHGVDFAAGKESAALLEFAISTEAVWACTSCGACVEVCPVGNEPMRDILDIRRSLVLMENQFPAQLQQAFKGMERMANPWNIAADARMDWAKGLNVPTIEQNPEPEVLWWVGCAPSTDARAQKTTQAFAKVLNAAGVNYAVLGKMERCTGDSARRSGNEALFFELATGNVEMLNEALGERPKRIVATCPHCLHTLKNEYPAFGGNYEVIHHTQLIDELFAAGKLKTGSAKQPNVVFHDPCYLGRHNDVYDAPRSALAKVSASISELPRARNNSFCCGAGGAQMWKEEEHGKEHVNENRFREAMATGKDTLAVGCPFCMVMMTDAARAEKSEMQVKDVAEIVAEGLSTDEKRIIG
ncbi:MAG TPA: (Fe-S)-binding protein [Anaerolineales bacterium]|nr:(Fe-S)-binding protein [Anaerolineales bacterium]